MTTYVNAADGPSHTGLPMGGRASGWLTHAAHSVWSFLTELGRRRAGAELRRLANGYELGRPELAAQLRDCARENDRRA